MPYSNSIVAAGTNESASLASNHRAAQRLHRFAVVRKILAPFRLQMSSSAMRSSRLSISSPPRCVSPLVASTSKMPSCSLQDRDVERAAAEIVNGDDAFLALVEPVGQRGGGGFVDEPQNFETGDAAGIAAWPAAARR